MRAKLTANMVTIKGYDMTILNLQQQNEEMTASNESLQKELDAMTSKYNQLDEASKTADVDHQNIVNGMRSEIAMLQGRLEEGHADQKEQTEGLRAEWKKAMEEVGSLKQQLAAKSAVIEDKVQEMNDLTVKYESTIDLLRQSDAEWETQTAQMLEAATIFTIDLMQSSKASL